MDNACVYVHLKVAYFWFMFGHGLLGFFFFYIIRNCAYTRKFAFSVDCFITLPLKCWKSVYLILSLHVWFKDNDEAKKKRENDFIAFRNLHFVQKWYFSIFVSKCYLIAAELLQINQFLFPTWTCSNPKLKRFERYLACNFKISLIYD